MIDAAALEQAEKEVTRVHQIGMDPKHSHELISNLMLSETGALNNFIFGLLGSTSRALGECKTQMQRDLVLATALRHVLAVGVVAERNHGEDA